jgi:hypothetical protein
VSDEAFAKFNRTTGHIYACPLRDDAVYMAVNVRFMDYLLKEWGIGVGDYD